MPDRQTAHYQVFLSHNSRDKGAVEPLAGMLKEKGINPFLDKWNLIPGVPIEDALIKALENSDSAAIFIGPGGEGPWQSEEMRDILKRAVKSRNEFRAIPVLLPNASAADLEKSFLGSRLWIEFKNMDDADALMRLAKAIQGEASGGDSLKLPDEPAPYRGLERFERIENPEKDFFFGRDEEIRTLVGRLVKARFVAVVGASGSGKSSLIRAGLTKQLAEDIHPGIRRWTTITVEPGSAPFRSLAVQIAVAAGIPVAEREDWIERAVEKWTTAPDGVRKTVETLFAGAKEPLLVFIDQFEELFTHRRKGPESESVARNFVANLEDTWRNGGDRVRVVVALRADFIDRCLEIGPLKELLQDRTMLVGEVGDDALREIVKEPAALVGAFLEKGLMERILKDVRSGSGSLPLLQQALHGLWRNRTGAWLAHDAYTASGGVARALNDQAQAAFKALDDAQKKIADSLFPRLITLGEGASDTRRRVKRKELYPQDVEAGAVNAVIDKLSGKDARILVTTREGGTAEALGAGEDFVEFTHEALLGNWEHLVTLLNSERTSIRRHRSLTTAAEEWNSKPAAENQKFLLREGQLVIAEQWAKDEGGYARLNQMERQFLDESIRERIAEEARKAQTARRLKVLSIGATAAAVLMAIVGGFAWFQWGEAAHQRDSATAAEARASGERDRADGQLKKAQTTQSLFLADLARQRRTASDAGTAILFALEALPDTAAGTARPYVPEAEFQLDGAWHALRERLILKGHEYYVVSAAFSPDGQRIVTASYDNTARLWDAGTGKPIGEPLKGHGDWVNSAAFSPDGKRIVTASKDKTARLWDADTGKPIGEPLKGHESSVLSAAFSPDGKRIVTASDDKTARLWDAGTGKPIGEPLKGHESSWVSSAAFSPDGQRIVTASYDNTARLWDAGTGKPIGEPLKGHESWVSSAAFSPDGQRIVTASYDKTARLWDAGTGKPIGEPLKGNEGPVLSAAFSPDGQRIVTASGDKTARLWDAATGKPIGEPLKGHEEDVTSAAFSPDGKRIVTASRDKTARLWDADTGKPIREPLKGHEWWVLSAAFSPDGQRIVTASGDKTARLWDADTGKPIGEPLEGHESWVLSAAFSPDGKRIVTASDDKTARLWDADTGKPIGEPLEGHESSVLSAAFSPDGQRIVTASYDKTARLWDAGTGKPIGEPLKGHESWVSSAAFSPDGQRIVTASYDKTARLWDAGTGKPIGEPLKGHESWVLSAAFSPDGQRIVTASGDKTARLWDGATGKPIGEPLKGHEEDVTSAAFSPDGKRIVTASRDRTARLWNADTGKSIAELTGHGNTVRSAAFSPDGQRIVTASEDTTARLWRIIANTQEFVAHAKTATPRCLTVPLRQEFFLPPEPPHWCIELEKWPYHTPGWKQWLADTRASKNPPLPAAR